MFETEYNLIFFIFITLMNTSTSFAFFNSFILYYFHRDTLLNLKRRVQKKIVTITIFFAEV